MSRLSDTSTFEILVAEHHGMCFGVRDALSATHRLAAERPATVLGQLVHNPEVDRHLARAGVRRGDLERPERTVATRDVVITAHGAADRDRRHLEGAGFRVTDTTCPLVRKAHRALATLVEAGCRPVVVGKPGHVEVRGLVGDFPDAVVIETEDDIDRLPVTGRLGIVSQTTQPVERVRDLVALIRVRRPRADVRFLDTVCQPTKDRQAALERLAKACDTVIAVGGANSNNTRQLVETARRLGARAFQVETPDQLRSEWFRGARCVGLTAGTSTLDETVEAVHAALRRIARAGVEPVGTGATGAPIPDR